MVLSQQNYHASMYTVVYKKSVVMQSLWCSYFHITP
jgi:hypothetical protein